MKTLSLTTILLCFCATHLFGQSCDLSDFLKLRLSDKETVNSALLACNLTPYDADNIGKNKVQVTYKNNEDFKTAEFYQWVDFVYAGNGKASGTNRISFQTQNQSLITNYLKEMQVLGFKYVRKKIVDRQIYEVYANNTHTIDVITSQSRYAYAGSGVYVNFAIYDTNEYEVVFAEENQKYTIQTENNNEYANFSAGIGE